MTSSEGREQNDIGNKQYNTTCIVLILVPETGGAGETTLRIDHMYGVL